MPSSTRKRPSPHSLHFDSSHDCSAEGSFLATSRPGLASRILDLIQLSDSRQLAIHHALDSSVSCESFDSFNSFDSFDSNEYPGLDCRTPGGSVTKSMKIESLGKNYSSVPPLSNSLLLSGSRECFDRENFDDLTLLAKTGFGGCPLPSNKANESLPTFSYSEYGGAVGASISSMERGLGRVEGELFAMDELFGHSIPTAGGIEVSTAIHGVTEGGVSVLDDVGTAGNNVSLDSVAPAGDIGTTNDAGTAGWSTTGIELEELREILFRDETDFIAANSSESWLEVESSHGLEHEISFSSSQVLPIGWDCSTDPENVNVEAARVLQEASALFSNGTEDYLEAGNYRVASGRNCSGEQYGDIWKIEEKLGLGEGMGGIVLESGRDKDCEADFTVMAPVLNSEHTSNAGVNHQTHNRVSKGGISTSDKLIQPSNLLTNSKKMTETPSHSGIQANFLPSVHSTQELEYSSGLKTGFNGNVSTNCNSELHSKSDVMEKDFGGLNKSPKNEKDMSLEFVLDPPWRPTSSHMEQLLVSCADAVNRDDVKAAYSIMQTLNCMVSQHGTAEQRMTYYFLEGLAARIVGTGSEIYLALQSRSGTEPGSTSKDMLAALLIFLEACPYANFGHEAANGAILEAFVGESNVHIIDFGITHGTQWPTLIEALAMRPEGPPKLRITGIDAPQTGLRPSSMQETGRRLTSFSRLMGVPFEFNAVTEHLENLQAEQFDVREGEALAVSCVLRLHQLRDENKRLDGPSPRNTTLKMIRSLNPKVVTLVEQHTDHNLHSFPARTREAIHYYRALFDSLDVSLPWNSTERVLIEERVLGRKIVNIIACEGRERVERHESCDRWHFRMRRAGFKAKALSTDVVESLQSLLKRYRDGYSLDQEGMAVLLTWQNQRLLAASTWEC